MNAQAARVRIIQHATIWLVNTAASVQLDGKVNDVNMVRQKYNKIMK